MNLATGVIENKINKVNSMWFSGHRTSKKRKEKEEKGPTPQQVNFSHFT